PTQQGPQVLPSAVFDGRASGLVGGHRSAWTAGDRIYGRYRRATLPDGRTEPICVELQSGARLGMTKQEGSKPGHAVGLKEGERDCGGAVEVNLGAIAEGAGLAL